MALRAVLVTLTAVLSLARATTFPPQRNITRYLFVTGDSYTTTGFNISVRPQPSYRHPLGNPEFPGVTLSGGENWIDVVVFNESRNSTSRDAKGTVAYNFAVGSNTVNISRTQLSPLSAPHPVADMIDQVDEIEALLHNQTSRHNLDWNKQNSLFINWFGINDIFYNGLFTDRNLTAAKPYLKADISDYFIQLERLYSLGARNFLTILVPPLERVPVIQAQPKKIEQAHNLTRLWNRHIQFQNVRFLNSHEDVQSNFYNPIPLFDKVLDNPTAYGAPNNTCFSYPAGQPCLWHDFIHPGLHIQELLGKAIFKSIDQTGFFKS